MFVPLWIIFLFTGLLMAVFAVTWGIRGRQFDDQDRARFLPLVGLAAEEIERTPGPHRAEKRAMIVLCVVGFSALLSGLFFALRHL